MYILKHYHSGKKHKEIGTACKYWKLGLGKSQGNRLNIQHYCLISKSYIDLKYYKPYTYQKKGNSQGCKLNRMKDLLLNNSYSLDHKQLAC